MKNEYTVGSLFSGIGGIEIGFEKEGFKTKWFIEKEPYAQAILKKRFPGTIIYEDVTKIDFRTVSKVDVFTGGFPCQDISGAGKKVGIEGSRSSLWKYYAKAIRILRPRIAFIENVSALTIRGLNVVLSDLAKIGYDAEWYNISASSVGAFHQRERIFIIAYPNSNREPNVSFNERQGQGIVDELSNSYDNRQKGKGKDEIRYKELPNTSSIRCDNGSNNRKERQIQDVEKRSIEKDKPEGNRREYRSSEVCKNISNPKCIGSPEQGKSRGSLHSEKDEDGKTGGFNDDGIWRIESDVGRTLDGFSSWLDRHQRYFYKAHKLIIVYGDAKKASSEEVLQELQNLIGEEILQWEARGLPSIPAEAVLFSFLCQYKSNLKGEKLSLEGEKISKGELRILRMEEKLTSSPQRPKHKKQQSEKSPNTLYSLSQILARYSEEAWINYRKENATNHWESGVSRTMNFIPNRVDRIKCLGNAVVPQCAEVFAKAIKMKLDSLNLKIPSKEEKC